jgi:hypothetical protein
MMRLMKGHGRRKGVEEMRSPTHFFKCPFNYIYVTKSLNLCSYLPVIKSSRPFLATFLLAQSTLS